MKDTFPAWYGDIETPLHCSSCGHEMFEPEVDGETATDFCPECGKQDVVATQTMAADRNRRPEPKADA